jgi:hypothetical protein
MDAAPSIATATLAADYDDNTGAAICHVEEGGESMPKTCYVELDGAHTYLQICEHENAGLDGSGNLTCPNTKTTIQKSEIETAQASSTGHYETTAGSQITLITENGVQYAKVFSANTGGQGGGGGNGGNNAIPEFSDYVLIATLLILGYAMRNRLPELQAIVNKK